jgi:hypothetical protein
MRSCLWIKRIHLKNFGMVCGLGWEILKVSARSGGSLGLGMFEAFRALEKFSRYDSKSEEVKSSGLYGWRESGMERSGK